MHQPHICKLETFLFGKNCHGHHVTNRCILNEQAFVKTDLNVLFYILYDQAISTTGNGLVRQDPSKWGTCSKGVRCQLDHHCTGARWLLSWLEIQEHQPGGRGRRKEALFFNLWVPELLHNLIFFTLFSPQICFKIGIIIYILRKLKWKRSSKTWSRINLTCKPMLLLLLYSFVTEQEQYLQVSRSEQCHCDTSFGETRL